MKIATYNVNSVNARLPVLLRWLADARPDVACLQELKAPPEKFPHAALWEAGYHAIWHGQKAWNGVAILARAGKPLETGRGLAGDPDDMHSRYLEGSVGDARVGCLYLPNGNPAPGPKFDYKLRWLERLAARGPRVRVGVAARARRPGRLGGRRPVPAGVARGVPPAARPGVDRLAPAPEPGRAGLHVLGLHRRGVAAASRLAAAGVDRDVRGWEKTSDHAPTWVELRDG